MFHFTAITSKRAMVFIPSLNYIIHYQYEVEAMKYWLISENIKLLKGQK